MAILSTQTKEIIKLEIVRFLRFLVGGSVYFWSGYAIFAGAYSGLHWHWLPAKIISDAVGITANYIIQRFWAFADTVNFSEIKHARRYLAIQLAGFVIDYLIIAGLKAIGITPYIGFFVSAAALTIWTYPWYRLWVFQPKRS